MAEALEGGGIDDGADARREGNVLAEGQADEALVGGEAGDFWDGHFERGRMGRGGECWRVTLEWSRAAKRSRFECSVRQAWYVSSP